MHLLLALIFSIAPFAAIASPVTCPPVTFEKLKSELKGKGEVNIIFFASWCAGCKPHLTNSYDENAVIIVVFDEQERAEKTLSAFAVRNKCYTSDNTAKELAVRSLPATRMVKF